MRKQAHKQERTAYSSSINFYELLVQINEDKCKTLTIKSWAQFT